KMLDAIAEEMNRDMTELQIEGQPKPYSISYKITEVDVNDVSAALGQTTSRRNRHFVNLEARVRVGTLDFDNGNFVVPDATELETRAKAVSAVFRDQPELRESRVALTSYLERRWYLTSEGTNVTDTRRASGVVIGASGQASDGQLLHDYFLRYGHTAKDLPS